MENSKKLSKLEQIQVEGLLFLSRDLNSKLLDIGSSLRQILGEEEEFGHCVDALYSSYTSKELYRKLNIKI